VARIKIAGTVYEIPTFNLGELRLLKREFDIPDVEDVSFGDPDFIAGLCYIVMRRANPDVTAAEVDAITEIELLDDPEDVAEDGSTRPTEAAVSGDPEQTDSNPETTPNDSGTPPTFASTT